MWHETRPERFCFAARRAGRRPACRDGRRARLRPVRGTLRGHLREHGGIGRLPRSALHPQPRLPELRRQAPPLSNWEAPSVPSSDDGRSPCASPPSSPRWGCWVSSLVLRRLRDAAAARVAVLVCATSIASTATAIAAGDWSRRVEEEKKESREVRAPRRRRHGLRHSRRRPPPHLHALLAGAVPSPGTGSDSPSSRPSSRRTVAASTATRSPAKAAPSRSSSRRTGREDDRRGLSSWPVPAGSRPSDGRRRGTSRAPARFR